MHNHEFKQAAFTPDEKKYFKKVRPYSYMRRHLKMAKWIFAVVTILIIVALFVPWQQTSAGNGEVIAFDPNERVFSMTALVNGRIKQWYVQDGQQVKAGQKIVEIIDNDPLLLNRLEDNKIAAQHELEANQKVASTALLNLNRQTQLYKEGLSSRKEMEKAKIEYEKLVAKVNESIAKLNQNEIRMAQQTVQVITAPRDGIITHVLPGSLSTQVKAGDHIANFVPVLNSPAVVFHVNPNDMQFIYAGRKLRLQFQGWPSVQFSGWPMVAIGTFGGIVYSVDPHVDPKNGLLRVIAIPDKNEAPWPDNKFLRVGAIARGTVILSQVPVGYEIWRQLNNFPLKAEDPTKASKEKSKDK
jgi:multidrug efflux pump subunit AcrA (membrane-fusion protein)